MSAGPFIEERLLLDLLLGRAAESEGSARGCNWSRMTELVRRESVGGYLHRKLQASETARLAPAEFLDALAVAYRKTAFDNLILLGRLREAAGALSSAGVPFIVLKGGALLSDLYPDAGMRSLTDIDLLVARAESGAARRALEGLGWIRGADHQIAARRCSYSTPEPGACLFEIHWDLSQRYRFQADLEGIWRGSRVLSLDGVEARRLGDVDELLYLALHYAAHYFGLSVKWLIDLVDLIRRRQPDWEEIGERARSWRGSAALHAALLFVRRSTPEIVSEADLERAGSHGALDRILAPYISEDPLRFLRELPYGPKRLLLAALLQDRWRDRIALAWLTQVRGHRHDD